MTFLFMGKNKLLITICIPTYNRSHYMLQTVQSVLDQTYTHFELLICDDGSTDDTQTLISSLKDKRIKKLKNTKNFGYIATMNKCTKIARGEWLMHLSDDDIMLPTLLEEQVKMIKKYADKQIAYIVPQSSNINSQNEIISITKKQLQNKNEILLEPTEAIENFTLYGKKIKDLYRFNTSFPSTLFNKKIFIKEGMSSEDVPVAHDLLIMAKLCLKYPVVFIDKPLFLYRSHENLGSSLNAKGTFLKEHLTYLELLLAFVKKEHIHFPYAFKDYCYNSLITYLFSLNGGLVRLGARYKGRWLKKTEIILQYMRFGLSYKKSLLIKPMFYISIALSFFPQQLLLVAGKMTKKI